MTTRPVIHVDEDEWVTIDWVGQNEQCCECGLKHKIDYRVHNGKLQFKGRRIR
jgi:hypothetical protein